MPTLTRTAELTVGGESGTVRYRAPDSNVSYEFWTKWQLSFREKLDDGLEYGRRIADCHRMLGRLCVVSLEGEWEGLESGKTMSESDADVWDMQYPHFAQALGQMIHARYWPPETAPVDTAKQEATSEPDPTTSGG